MASLLNPIRNQSRLIDLKMPRLEEVSETRYIISNLLVLFGFGAMDLMNNRIRRDVGVCIALIVRTSSNTIITEEHLIEILCYAVLDSFKVSLFHGLA